MTNINNNKIPKIIHYCWFGKDKNGNSNPKPQIILDCIESWKKHLPEYELKQWSENNFDPASHPYTDIAYKNKKWAFVSDYVRLKAINDMGGVYLDTDMYVLRSFDFLGYDLVLGKEDNNNISAGMIASTKNNPYIKDLLEQYNNTNVLETIPIIMTRIWNKNKQKYTNINTKIFDPIFFYSFDSKNIKKFKYTNQKSNATKSWTHNAPNQSYAVHLWNYSWGHPLNKFFKKIGIHSYIKYITEKLKIKKIIKNIAKMQ